MIIYCVYNGNDYDGGGISNPVFKLKTDALMEAHALAQKYNNTQNYQFVKYSDVEWRDGHDYIRIMTYELI